MVGGGGALGIFWKPRDPERYMRESALALGPSVTIEPLTDRLVLDVVLLFSVDVAPFPWLRLQSLSELALASTTVHATRVDRNGNLVTEERTFGYTRFGETVLVNWELPVNDTKTMHAFLGGGAGIHYVTFEEHTGLVPGFRAQLGLGILQQVIRVDGVIGVDYVRGKSKLDQTWLDGRTTPFILDYSSVHLDAVVRYNAIP